MMKMKTKILIIFAILLLLPICANAWINDVNIIPSLPTTSDVISIFTSGIEAYGSVTVTDANFYQDGALLKLDIFLEIGGWPATAHWSHSEEIGTLPAGQYGLTVREYTEHNLEYIEIGTKSVSFEVTPEPTTLGIFGFALPIFRRFTSAIRHSIARN
jgi:hypothetical protein